MTDTLRIDQFIQQLWDSELGYLDDLITQEMRRRAQRIVMQGDGVAYDRHVPLATARVIETGAA
jgi:hypothetical protein